MEYLLLFIIVVLMALQNFWAKQYELKTEAFNAWIFSGMTTFGIFLFFLCNAGFKPQLALELVPYILGFAVFFGGATIGGVMAIRTGLFSLSSLVVSYSLVVPTLYGILFLGEPIGIWGYAGIVLLLISLYLLNQKKQDEGRFSFKWLFWVFVAFFGNGICSTVQKMQQLAFDGAFKNELMLWAMVILTVAFFGIGFASEKQKNRAFLGTVKFGLLRGIAIGVVNFLVMVLSGVLPTALLFPMISAGGIVIAFILALTVYRERLSVMQIAGYIIGTTSVVLLNL